MQTVPDRARWDRALGASKRVASKVELWSEGRYVADVPVLSWSVKDVRVTGIRRTLSLTVPHTRAWLRWLAMPVLEARPYRGFRWSRDRADMCPLGRFPIVPPAITYPKAPISITADDYWSRVNNAKFLQTMSSYPGSVFENVFDGTTVRIATQLIGEVSLVWPTVTASGGQGLATTRIWDKDSRHDTVVEYLDAMGAEAFIDPVGTPVIQDYANTVGGTVAHGVGGTIVSVGSVPNWADVRNTIAASSSATDVVFDPAIVAIENPSHPAHMSRIGVRSEQFKSPLLRDRTAAFSAAWTMLAKRSAAARTVTVTCVCDPSRVAGDLMTVVSPFGTESLVLSEVMTPASGAQTLTLVSP